MSDRLTSEWTETLDDAFGESGTKGRLGEEFLAKVFDSWGWEYELTLDSRKDQLEGRDIRFRNPKWSNFYSADVKNNMPANGTLYIYKNWLFKIKCDRVFHVNPETGWVTWYGVDEMREVYDTTHTNKNGDEYMTIPAKDRKQRFPFIKASKYNG